MPGGNGSATAAATRSFTVWVAIAGAVLSAYALWTLLAMRLRTGESYPPYSTFRADPVGAKAVYESLAMLRGVDASRSLTTRPRASQPAETALFFLGLHSAAAFDRRALDIASAGGRLVLMLLPTTQLDWWGRARQAMSPPAAADGAPETMIRLDALGLSFAQADRGHGLRAGRSAALDLPESLAWHGASTFTGLDADWRIIYTLGEEPVLIEKDHGDGTVVLGADGYFLSNEALRDDRQPELIAWLAGGKPRVMFDEAHLGVGGDPGLVSLARNLGLGGVAASLLVLAVLFLWRSAARFLPPRETTGQDGEVRVLGKDSQAGFESLLRRAAAEADLIKVCVEEWRKSEAVGLRLARDRSEALEALVVAHLGTPPRQRDNLATYQRIVGLLRERQWKKHSNG